tara:strand:- start:5008 stop:5658 length:651 start_codon:yes stop_codon:yes gene_type:complete
MQNIDIRTLLAKSTYNIHHKKRERAVYYNDGHYIKLWVKDWEHCNVARHGFDIGYYDEKNAPACLAFVVDVDGKSDLGYVMKKGNVTGGSKDSWAKLIEMTSLDQRKSFIREVFDRSRLHSCIVSDMCPANVIVSDEEISLIDYEGLGSFNWFFNGQPEEWEAQSRNLKKCPNPYWRDMSKYLKRYVKECLDISFDKDISTVDAFNELYELIKEAT